MVVKHSSQDAFAPHNLPWQGVLTKIGSSLDGLTPSQVRKNQEKFGPNVLPEDKSLRIIRLFFSQFVNAMVALMIVAALLSLAFGHTFDAALILGIVLVNVCLGFVQEYRAERSVAALRHLLVSKVVVRRDGTLVEIPQDEITIGDIIHLQEGAKVPADARIVSAHNCSVIEASLTGESLPENKSADMLSENTDVADRTNMLWMGTTIAQGSVEAVVTAIGSRTEFGKIAVDLNEINTRREHFSQKVSILSKQMGAIAIVSAITTFLVGFFLRGFSFADISIYTVATLVSALPEGLPVILVIVLSIGAQRMARKNAIVRKLAATETLGVVSVILTDKTGTLTQNTMSVKYLALPHQPHVACDDTSKTSQVLFSQKDEPLVLHENPQLRMLISIAALCNNVRVKGTHHDVAFQHLLGDPTERALYLLGHQAGYHKLAAKHKIKKIDDLPFQQDLRLRASLVTGKQGDEIYIVGAPESVLQMCHSVQHGSRAVKMNHEEKRAIEESIRELSQKGLRVVAAARLPAQKESTKIEVDYVKKSKGMFVGLVGMYDPPRPEVKEAIIRAREAGIEVYMVTGDHPETALAIGKEIGLVPADAQLSSVLTQKDIDTLSDADIYSRAQRACILARLTPEAKLKIADIFQRHGKIIAMTGDGVNDAPALKKADVGIAMGITGTDVAREASKIILTDDNFASIISAIHEGRTQFNNLRRTSIFLIMTNIAESAALLIALLMSFPLPLLPIQILWLNVITGGFTDFALSLEPTHDDSMKVPPRSPQENILGKKALPLITAVTLATTVCSLAAFAMFLPNGIDKARTALFVVLSCSQLLNMVNLRSIKRSAFEMGLISNKPVLIVLCFSILLLLGALFLGPFTRALHFVPLTVSELALLVVLSTGIFATAEAVKVYTRKAYGR